MNVHHLTRASLVLALLAAAPIAGLVASCVDMPHANAPGEAECPVCWCEGDMACLIVKIQPSTPRAEYEGKTYYFCSAGCRDEFVKDPARYAARAR